ncbi:hypothetical protein CTAYLR_007845 [Chrysophaeum taylorii]|uniref:PRP1 splicing factor N-terminal domain-containing protein n=1 Tax=Chrysophaeum taylorii TaxID=2483200 RepID=A0AAD7UAN0_9STRA|nr:hypothetical protein CTAYLR_007845 [Chrysophaeum taylorii]
MSATAGKRIPPTVKPTNYVAGLGRGAVGFTTRSDIGPAREAPARAGGLRPGEAPAPESVVGRGHGERTDFGEAPEGYVAGMGRGMGEMAMAQGETTAMKEKLAREDADLNESNFDRFAGYGGALFENSPYDADDQEADRIYEAIDERMDSRRKRAREEKLLETMKRYREERPKISDQFADLKRELKDVTRDEWEGIPDIGDQSLRHKQKKRPERYTPMTDEMMDGLRAKSSAASSLDPRQQAHGGFETPLAGGTRTPMGGWRTPMVLSGGASTVAGTLTTSGLAAARGTVLGLRLDKMSDSVTGQTVVDPKGYLTDLNAIKVNTASEVGDIKKARLLLKSVTTTNPKHAPGWIAAARVEEIAGKAIAARKIIQTGCEVCPDSEDVWLEAARLQSGPNNAKAVLATAVAKLPTSTKLWLEAAALEDDDLDRKKAVLRRALELVPSSVKLWRTAIELEDVEDARILLGRAVECVPHSVDMWLALARLETYENARRVLNQAREAIPTDPAIWLTAAKLEEARGNGAELVERIVSKAVSSLASYQVVIDRDAWLQEAEAAEAAAAPLTCGAVVRHTIGLGVEDEDRRRTWLDDADNCVARGSIETGRAILAHALAAFPKHKTVWLRACDLEKKHGSREQLEATLAKAVSSCPRAEILWLMAAKEKWLAGDVDGARATLVDAFAANPDSEQVWLAAVKLEWENDEPDRARALLSKARDKASSPRVWMKSALLERERGNYDAEISLVDEAIEKYPTFAKFYMMAGQARQRRGDDDALVAAARDVYRRGVQRCPKSAPLWKLAAALEERAFGPTKARSILELARLKNPKMPELWLASIRLERRHDNRKLADNLSAKAIQECPDAGELWADDISNAPKPQRKARSLEALKRCDQNPHVIVAVANLFSQEQKSAKARKWFNRAVALDPDLGDAWANYYAFELQDGTHDQQQDVKTRCVAADPAHGELWTAVSKHPPHARADTATKLDLIERVQGGEKGFEKV